ncbi:peroxidase [Anopheles bellator]|uniref:peroxidase n=1 Tax=Anopheles bellator TaxID=139047 RepID=UPI00264969A5|nr:peroxidase [Anopheles bellator]
MKSSGLASLWCASVILLLLAAIGQPFEIVERYGLANPTLAQKMIRLANPTHLDEALEYGEMVVEKSKRLEASISGAGSRVKVTREGTTYAQTIDGYPTPSTERQDLLARTVLRASAFIVNRYCLPAAISSTECGAFLGAITLPDSSPLTERCRAMIASKEHNDEYRRLLPAAYDDGIYTFRRSVSGGELPLARQISGQFHTATQNGGHRDAGRHSVALVQWSQFIEHDLAKTTVQTMHDGTQIECCTNEHGPLLPRYRHPASCAPLPVPAEDPFYRKHQATCLNYVRSALSLGETCHLGPANQLNAATARLDLSQVYGSTANDTSQLRSLQGGRLRAQHSDSLDYLPKAASEKLCVADDQLEITCYSSGDSRVNVNPYVTLLHTLFLRSHNHLAKHLARLAPHWTDEQLFNVSRQVNTRVYQNIVREWLTTVAGRREKSKSVDRGDDGVSNEFATAAIRFYHTMMPGVIGNGTDLQPLFYRPKDLRKRDYFIHLVGSVLQQSAMALDTEYVDDVAHLLFGATGQVGLDVLALDIQRGRDHGLARYVDYYALCNGDQINGWSDLESVMKPNDLAILRSVYASVRDIDLVVGGIAERPKDTDATVGPTFACLIREQIERSLHMAPSGLSIDLDAAVADYGGARFMCDTTMVDRVQQDIFRLPSAVDNPQVPCSQLPALDLARVVRAIEERAK